MNWSGEERRQHQPITREDLTEVVGLALERHVHSDSHQFVETLMGKEKRRQELWEGIKRHVFGWGAVAVIAFLAASVWNELLDALHLLFKGK